MNHLRLSLLLAAATISSDPLLLGGEAETQRLYLTGRGKDDAVPWRFMCTTGAQSGFWTNIPVPSNWELHGFGTLSYRKDPTNAWTERGLYEKDFVVPSEWAGRRVFLVFEGVMTDTSAKVNGESVGPTHQGGFYRFKYEITKLVRFGATNLLEVTVAKHSANESVNKAERMADYWVFGGIYRPVYLEAVPAQFVERVAIDARHDGAFAMDVFVRGISGVDGEMSVEAQILTLDCKPVGEPFASGLLIQSLPTGAEEGSHRAGEEEAAFCTTLTTRIVAPHTWTAETPNLYCVEVRLKRGSDTVHRFKQRFGFRTFEVRDGDGLYLNGRKIILKGVNRHSFWPDSGRCLSEAVHRLDIETIKAMNGNAVRTSHYPPDTEFLDLCDELGLYVLDELAGWHNHYDTETGAKLVEAMVTRDVNHPCILFWNNGNEGGFNTNLDAVFVRFDPQKRRVLHPWASFNGLCTAHYLAYDKAEIAASGRSVYFQPPDKELVATNDPTRYIYMPTEFLHGMFDGGAGAGLEDYWRMMMSHSNCAGGFIWALFDEAVRRPDTGQLDTAGNQAPDGIVGPYRQREGSFYAIKQIWSPIVIYPNTNRSRAGDLVLENRYDFTDTKLCKFRIELRRLPSPHQTGSCHKVVAARQITPPDVSPGGKGTFRLRLPPVLNPNDSPDVLAITVEDPAQRQVYSWVRPTNLEAKMANLTAAKTMGSLRSVEKTSAIQLTAGDLTVTIDKRTGLLSEIWRGGQRYSLSNGPIPVVGAAKLKKISRGWHDRANAVVFTRFEGCLGTVEWRLSANGWLHCQFSYSTIGTNESIGVTFDYPEGMVKRKRWLGDGPYRVWKNRMCGVTLGVWENDYNNTITGWREWIYPEFKGCFANVRWLQLETTEGLITVVPHNIPFVQVLTPEQPPDNLAGKTKVNLPKCGLGFLHAIPPIGTKFKPPEQGGPQGQPNVGRGKYRGSVSFYFGNLP